LLVDAKNDRAVRWYESYGRSPKLDAPLSLVLPLATAADAQSADTVTLRGRPGLRVTLAAGGVPDHLAPGLDLGVALSNAREIGCSRLDRVCACRHDGDGFLARLPEPDVLRQCGSLRRVIRLDHGCAFHTC
jgi:hypothetical protein